MLTYRFSWSFIEIYPRRLEQKRGRLLWQPHGNGTRNGGGKSRIVGSIFHILVPSKRIRAIYVQLCAMDFAFPSRFSEWFSDILRKSDWVKDIACCCLCIRPTSCGTIGSILWTEMFPTIDPHTGNPKLSRQCRDNCPLSEWTILVTM